MLRTLRIENLVLIREAELAFGPGLNAVTGATGAGKTIFAQAIGLLLGARADASSVGGEGAEAYVEAELDVPDGFFDDDELAAIAELRPEGEAGLVVARCLRYGRTRARVGEGRSRARRATAVDRDRDVGPFDSASRAGSFQLDVLDAFCGATSGSPARRGRAGVTWSRPGGDATS